MRKSSKLSVRVEFQAGRLLPGKHRGKEMSQRERCIEKKVKKTNKC